MSSNLLFFDTDLSLGIGISYAATVVLSSDAGPFFGISAPFLGAIALFLDASTLFLDIGALSFGVFLFTYTLFLASFFPLSTLSIPFYIPQSAFIWYTLFIDISHLLFFIACFVILSMQTKLKVQKWLKATFLNFPISAELQSTIIVINKKKLFNKVFIIKLFASSHIQKKLDLNFV